jgi:hypothetical protein
MRWLHSAQLHALPYSASTFETNHIACHHTPHDARAPRLTDVSMMASPSLNDHTLVLIPALKRPQRRPCAVYDAANAALR